MAHRNPWWKAQLEKWRLDSNLGTLIQHVLKSYYSLARFCSRETFADVEDMVVSFQIYFKR